MTGFISVFSVGILFGVLVTLAIVYIARSNELKGPRNAFSEE